MRTEFVRDVILERARRGQPTNPAQLAQLTDEYGREHDLAERELAVAERERALASESVESDESDVMNVIRDQDRLRREEPGLWERIRGWGS
jgi:hypothetical protein